MATVARIDDVPLPAETPLLRTALDLIAAAPADEILRLRPTVGPMKEHGKCLEVPCCGDRI